MRPSRILLVCLLALAALPRSGTAKSAKELMSDLQAALRDETAAHKRGADGSAAARRDQMLPYLAQQLDGRYMRGGEYDVDSILTQISASSRSEKVLQICLQLGAQLQTERIQQETAFAADADAAVKHTGEVALQAKEEKDMDVVLQEIARLHGDRYEQRGSELSRRASSKLEAASQFASHWQDYLAQVKTGNPKAARATLQSLSQNTSYPIVPRSEILARIQTVTDAEVNASRDAGSSIVSKADALCNGVRTPEDIARALLELKSLHQDFPSDVDTSRVSELDSLASVYQQIQAGLTIPVNLLDSAHYFTELRLRLILLALPRYLGVADRFKPLPEDTAGVFLDRVAADARKTSNWPLLLKTVEADRFTARADNVNRSSTWRPAVEPLRAFITGQNEEQAAQYASAVASYQAALKDTEALVPVDAVRDRLAALKREHPTQFEEGAQRAFNPPTASYRYPPGYSLPVRPTAPPVPVP